MSTEMSAAMRRVVCERAHGHCEYCFMPGDEPSYPHEPDHIISRKHQGSTIAENLAYACFACNRAKGSDIASIDPSTGALTPLFNPRLHVWTEHFRFNGAVIAPLTPVGRVTVLLLRLNQDGRVALRDTLMREDRYPHPTA